MEIQKKQNLLEVTNLLAAKQNELILKINEAKNFSINELEIFLKQTDFKEIEFIRKGYTERLDEVKKNLMEFEKKVYAEKIVLEKRLIELKEIEQQKIKEANEKIKLEAAERAAKEARVNEINLFIEKRKVDFFKYCVKEKIQVGQIFVDENFEKICAGISDLSLEQKELSRKVYHEYFSTFELRKKNYEIEIENANRAAQFEKQKNEAAIEAAKLAQVSFPEIVPDFKELKIELKIEIENTREFGIEFLKIWLANFDLINGNLRGEKFASVNVERVCAAIIKSNINHNFKTIEIKK